MASGDASSLRRLERRIRRWEYNRVCIIRKLRDGSGDVETLSSCFVLAQRKLEKLRSRAGVLGLVVPEASQQRVVDDSYKRDKHRSRERECNGKHGRSKSRGRRGDHRRERSVGAEWRAAATRWAQEVELCGLGVPRRGGDDNKARLNARSSARDAEPRSSTPSSASHSDVSSFSSGCGESRRGGRSCRKSGHSRRRRSSVPPRGGQGPYGYGDRASAVAAALRALAPEASGLQSSFLGSEAEETLSQQLLASLQPPGRMLRPVPSQPSSTDAAILQLMQQMHAWQPLNSHLDPFHKYSHFQRPGGPPLPPQGVQHGAFGFAHGMQMQQGTGQVREGAFQQSMGVPMQPQMQQLPQQFPQQFPQQLPQQVPQQLPQQLPQRLPQQVPPSVQHVPLQQQPAQMQPPIQQSVQLSNSAHPTPQQPPPQPPVQARQSPAPLNASMVQSLAVTEPGASGPLATPQAAAKCAIPPAELLLTPACDTAPALPAQEKQPPPDRRSVDGESVAPSGASRGKPTTRGTRRVFDSDTATEMGLGGLGAVGGFGGGFGSGLRLGALKGGRKNGSRLKQIALAANDDDDFDFD
eukprot:Hpha_TRINITY_DN22789_c0_g1::TRINITY_DN22789_c0_g1_i1::g.34284::m.34284